MTSLTVRVTSTSDGPAADITRAAMWMPIPATSASRTSTMPVTISRRATLIGALLAAPTLAPAFAEDAETRLTALERINGGRLGVAVLDTATGERSDYRGDERFPMCSTFKFLLVSAVLQRMDGHREALDRAVAIPPKPLLFNSPLTETNAGGSMTIAALCHAALTPGAVGIR